MIKRDMIVNPDKSHRVDVRWWLAEGFHTDQTLLKDVRMLDEAGFGSIEFLAMEEPGADSRLYGWGSEEWVHDSGTIITETTRRGMGFSVTSGTNWSNANLISITPDDKAAAKELDYVVETLVPGQTRSGSIPRSKPWNRSIHDQDLVAVVAARLIGETEGDAVLDQNTLVLTDQVVDDTLTWSAPADGTYKLFFFWLHGTGQIARPSISTSYTINYLDRYGIEAFIAYWDTVVLTPELRETIRENGHGMMYMDSLELSTFGAGGQLWGYHLLEEFQARRGYSLTPYLPFIVKNSGQMTAVFLYHYKMEDELKTDRVRNDLYQTMTELYMDNMLKPMQEWLHGIGMTLRAEVAYGLPFEVSQSGKYVDGLETESLEFTSQIDSYRNMAGSAHIYGKIFSSETGATQMNYMKGLEFYTQIIYTQFAVGVSRTVLHGYSSIAGSDESTYWPGHEGMWPIFSERFGSRQPAYQHYHDWTDAMARYQLLIRRGKPRVDLGILRLDYYLNNLLFVTPDEDALYSHELMRGDEALYWRDMELQHAGYSWDYFAPQLLEEEFADVAEGELFPEGPGYRALIVYQEYMPVSSAKRLLELARKGLKIVFVNGTSEIVRPGITVCHTHAASHTPFWGESDAELKQLIDEIKGLPGVTETDVQAETIRCLETLDVYPRAAFAVPNKNILTFMNRTDSETGLFVYNMLYTQTEPLTFTLDIDGGGKPYVVDCWNAEIMPVSAREAGGRTRVTLTLRPGEATMLLLDREGKAKVIADNKIYGESIRLPIWDLTVEDWNEGEKKLIIEDRGLGIVTNEVYYETSKTPIEVGRVELKPWRDYPAVGKEVSGVGYYSTKVHLPADWSEDDGAELHIPSTGGNTAAVYVNGQKARAYDFNRHYIDISELLHGGENTIEVEVSSTLTNRLLARDYYKKSVSYTERLSNSANNAHKKKEDDINSSPSIKLSVSPVYQDYGMIGAVELRTYKNL
ncbi:MAG: hypothetical protein LIO67_01560 [Lachnospiraceae bacterium]|nr:hypothetical protein [Lachnospiraceae bacterium]